MTDIPLLLGATLEVTGTRISDAAIALIVRRLALEDQDGVRHALGRCAEECKYRVTLADILERMPAPPPTPRSVPTDPEEAWDLAVRLLGSASEAQTVVVPTAILRAFPIATWDAGDKVGARMSFKAAWESARAGHGETWTVSEGTDKSSREAVIVEAAERGVISASQARRLLPGSARAAAIAAGTYESSGRAALPP